MNVFVPGSRTRLGESGFSLMEAIVATVIAVIAALGLAYSFGIGRANVNRFETARVADARAQGRMEHLSMLMTHDPTILDLQAGLHPDTLLPFEFNGTVVGHEYWRIDTVPPAAPATIRPKMALLTVEVAWAMGGVADTARYTRLFGRHP